MSVLLNPGSGKWVSLNLDGTSSSIKCIHYEYIIMSFGTFQRDNDNIFRSTIELWTHNLHGGLHNLRRYFNVFDIPISWSIWQIEIPLKRSCVFGPHYHISRRETQFGKDRSYCVLPEVHHKY